MRVLHVVPLIADGAAYGGPIRTTFRQCEELTAQGHSCHILALWRGDQKPRSSHGAAITAFPFRRIPGHPFAGAFSVSALNWLRRHAQEFDIVHIHSGRDLWLLVAARTLDSVGVPFVWQSHGMIAPRSSLPIRLLDRALTRPALRRASSVFYLTNYERRDLITIDDGLVLTRLINGVEAPPDRPIDVRGNSVVFISRIHPRKRLGDLVTAVGALQYSHDLTLDVFGPDEGDLDHCVQLVQDLGVSRLVHFRGALDYGAVATELSVHDILVLPSEREPWPGIVMEALSAGLLVICTTQCGLAPYIQEYAAGIVSEVGEEGITTALRRALELSIDDRFAMAQRARELAASRLSMHAVGEVMVQEYSRAIGTGLATGGEDERSEEADNGGC
jgi:glycosyltransferase involved in cell wall biosynthesis